MYEYVTKAHTKIQIFKYSQLLDSCLKSIVKSRVSNGIEITRLLQRAHWLLKICMIMHVQNSKAASFSIKQHQTGS